MILDLIMWFSRFIDNFTVFEDGSYIFGDSTGCIPSQLCD